MRHEGHEDRPHEEAAAQWSQTSERVRFSGGRKVPVILQTEAAECGLACLAMLANYHGHSCDLLSVRRQSPISLKGATLRDLIEAASQLNFQTRAVRLELSDVSRLRLPCLVHWSFSHFVVLEKAGRHGFSVVDPARGRRRLSEREFSDGFTGVALEAWPAPGFQRKPRTEGVSLFRLFGAVRGYVASMAQVITLALALEVLSILSPFLLQWTVDDVLVSEDRDLLTTLVLGFGVLLALQQVLTVARGWALLNISTTFGVQARANTFRHLLRLPLEYFEKRHLGDILSRFSSLDAIQRTVTATFSAAVLDGFTALLALIVMFLYSPRLALISVAAVVIYGIGRWLWYRPLRSATEEQIVHAARQQSHFLESVRGVKPIRIFGRESVRHATWMTTLVDQVNADLRSQKLQLWAQTANGVIFGVENLLVIWIGAKAVMGSTLSAGMLLAFISFKSQFGSRVASLIDRMVEFAMLGLQGERLADIVHAPQESGSQGMTRLVHEEAATLEPVIELSGVRFRYAPHEPEVLSGVDLRIEAGESIAIVGASGCGKSTLLNLILGVVTPSDGTISLGGTNLSSLGIQRLRAIVGAVSQDDVLFEGSIADNICFFDSAADPAWIEQCAKAASIHSDIVAMPMGYNSLVGYMGSALSGGQRQRVLLARALYKRPKILILDEATSHLDLRREIMVNAAIRALNITRIVVAHRPQTAESADRIVTLANGRVSRIAVPGAGVADLASLQEPMATTVPFRGRAP